MKQNKFKLTLVMVMIMVMSLTLFSVAYAAVYEADFLSSTVKTISKGMDFDQVDDKDDDDLIQLALLGESDTGLPIYDPMTLGDYNGKNGQPTYVAFEGLVYEVGQFTSWVGGFHNGYEAGKDLTEAFKNSPHAKSIFDEAEVVGTYSETVVEIKVATSEDKRVPVIPNQESTPQTVTVTSPSQVMGVSQTNPNFTAETLSQYNGKNGQAAYVAFEGTVYEVGKFTSWVGGFHNGYEAGKDLTEAFKNSPHAKSIFDHATVIGTYGELVADAVTSATPPESTTVIETSSVPSSTPQTQETQTTSEATNTSRNFTADTLSQYNGKNGQAAYIAINGVVYEVSTFTNWAGGFHKGYEAGKDLTQAFGNSPHTLSILKNANVVGTYGQVASQTPDTSLVESQTGMTLVQLSQYTGQNGQAAYIAVNGVVYDVTSYWKSGQHKGLTAGADMTAAFAGSPHSQSLLSGLPVIGKLAADQQVIDPNIMTKTGHDEDDDDYEEHEDEDEDDEHEHEDEDEDDHDDEHDDDHEDDDDEDDD